MEQEIYLLSVIYFVPGVVNDLVLRLELDVIGGNPILSHSNYPGCITEGRVGVPTDEHCPVVAGGEVISDKGGMDGC